MNHFFVACQVSVGLTAIVGPARLASQAVPQYAVDGTQLVRTSPPVSEEAWSCANYQSEDTWRVASAGGSIQIWRTVPADAGPVQLAVPGGTLIGYNSGEFGGQLVFRDSARLTEKTILSGNPIAIFRRATDNVILVEGLGHMGLRRGHVIGLTAAAPTIWNVSSSIDIGTAPQAATIVGDTVLIATSEGVLSVSLSEKTVAPVFQNDNWYLLYATTIVQLPSRTILVGMRRAVAELTLGQDGYHEHWWVPVSCRGLNGPRNGPCTCRS